MILLWGPVLFSSIPGLYPRDAMDYNARDKIIGIY